VVPIPIENAVDKNLTGLIANQLLSNYNRSVILLNENIDENGIKSWSGSARGYDKSNFKNFKLIVEQSNLVEYAEGQWPITPFPFINGVAQAANEEAE
jgi:single-stranded DNA-specific DHH superfamily exonuclease